VNGNDPPVEVRVWGDLACFTRPELKTERVSYAVMTPSAARGVLESIFWKPEFQWVVREIHVLREPRYFSILRNEVNERQTDDRARSWSRAGGIGSFDPTEPRNRAQRHTLALRDVCYVIRADVTLRPGVEADAAKFRDQFRRRVRRGQCANQPYLGCREFAAAFAEPDGSERPGAWPGGAGRLDLGRMLLDLEYGPRGTRAVPRFFEAALDDGVLRVPLRPLLWEVA
jgi:CRISPR-associated protein Cas5d